MSEFGQPSAPQVGAANLGVLGPQPDAPPDLATWFEQILNPANASLFDPTLSDTAWLNPPLTDPTRPDLPGGTDATDAETNER